MQYKYGMVAVGLLVFAAGLVPACSATESQNGANEVDPETGEAQQAMCWNGYAEEPDKGSAGPQADAAWSCSRSAFHFKQFLTCAEGALHVCDQNGNGKFYRCRYGCEANETGKDDICRPCAKK